MLFFIKNEKLFKGLFAFCTFILLILEIFYLHISFENISLNIVSLEKDIISNNVHVLSQVQRRMEEPLVNSALWDIWTQHGTTICYALGCVASLVIVGGLFYYFSSRPGTPPNFGGSLGDSKGDKVSSLPSSADNSNFVGSLSGSKEEALPFLSSSDNSPNFVGSLSGSKEEKVDFVKNQVKALKRTILEYDQKSMCAEERTWLLNDNLEHSFSHLSYPYAEQHISFLKEKLEALELALELSAQSFFPVYFPEEANKVSTVLDNDTTCVLKNLSIRYVEIVEVTSSGTFSNVLECLIFFFSIYLIYVLFFCLLIFFERYFFYKKLCTLKVLDFSIALSYLRFFN